MNNVILIKYTQIIYLYESPPSIRSENARNFQVLTCYELITINTFQNNACFTISGQIHNGGSKTTYPNPNPSRNPNPPKP